jgi:hypothetical protein
VSSPVDGCPGSRPLGGIVVPPLCAVVNCVFTHDEAAVLTDLFDAVFDDAAAALIARLCLL